MNISVKLIESKNEFIANCPELDINCYGSNQNEAIERIKDVIHFYIDSAKELGLDIENLNKIIINGTTESYIQNRSQPTISDLLN